MKMSEATTALDTMAGHLKEARSGVLSALDEGGQETFEQAIHHLDQLADQAMDLQNWLDSECHAKITYTTEGRAMAWADANHGI